MKAIVFSQFWMHVQLIAAELKARGVRHVLLKGDMPARDKQAAVMSFRAARAPCCMVMDESGGLFCLWTELMCIKLRYIVRPAVSCVFQGDVVVCLCCTAKS
jgi:hypothetical protein